jgi:hypothetical protein
MHSCEGFSVLSILLIIITFIVTPTIPGMLTFSRKDQEYGAEQPVCPDEPQKSLTSLAQWLKAPPLHL